MKTLILIAAALAPAALAAQSPADERAILAARDTVWRAWFANDTILLGRFLPPTTIATSGGGAAHDVHWDDRRAILAGARQSATAGRRLEKIEFAGTDIDLRGGTAFVRSRFRYVVAGSKGADTVRGTAAELFVRDRDRWVNPFWHLDYDAGAYAGRTIDLPDTLGANVALADSAASRGTPADYDALIGTWEFRFQTRNRDGSFAPAFTGHWTFEKRPGDGIIEDRWRADDPSAPMGVSLYTYRIFDPARKVWQLVGAWSQGGAIVPGLSWSDGDGRYGLERANGELRRFRYFALGPDHFLWRSDRSSDGGKTWHLDNGIMEAKRVGR